MADIIYVTVPTSSSSGTSVIVSQSGGNSINIDTGGDNFYYYHSSLSNQIHSLSGYSAATFATKQELSGISGGGGSGAPFDSGILLGTFALVADANQLSGFLLQKDATLSGWVDSAFVKLAQTGQFFPSASGNLLITPSQTGAFQDSGAAFSLYYPRDNPSGYIQVAQTGTFQDSGSAFSFYYPRSNPSGYITGIYSGDFALRSETGDFVTNEILNSYVPLDVTGAFYPREGNPSSFLSGDSINLQNYQLFDSSENVSVDWDTRLTYDGSEAPSADWNNRILQHSNFATVVDWGSQILADYNSISALDWLNRKLNDNLGVESLNWSDKILTGNWATNTTPVSSGHVINKGYLDSKTGLLYPSSNPSGFLASSQTGVFMPLISGGEINSRFSLIESQYVAKTMANTSVPSGNTISNTISETAFSSSYTIPANTLEVGDVFRITLRGVYGTTVVAPTLTIKLKFNGSGGTILLNSGALTTVAGVTNGGWVAHGLFTVVTIGGSGTVEAQGDAFFASAATTTLSSIISNTDVVSSCNTTADAELTITVTWGTASASNTITLRQMIVEKL